MTKGISSSYARTSKSAVPNDPRGKLYPYAYSLPIKNDDGETEHFHLFTTSSTLLNNLTRQLGYGDRYENGVFVIDYSFNNGKGDEEEEEEAPKKRQRVKA